jgi:hypothetical protein
MEAETRLANGWTLRIAAVAACLAASGVTTFAQSPTVVQPAPNQAPHAWRKADTPNNPAPAVENNNQPAPVENAGPAPEETQAQAAPPAEAEPWPAQDPAAAQAPAGQQPPAPPQNTYPPQQQQPYPPNAYPPQQQQPYPPNAYPPQQQQASYPPNAYGNYPIPATLTISPGSYITVRVNGWLSSDKNQPGDAFTATLAEPVIVNGVVVAQRGQTVGGVVTEAKKAGHVEGTSSLGVRLTDLTTADGQRVNLQTAMMARRGDTSIGRDAAAIGGTTALGAAVGAAADWGRGAAIGAGAGAAAGIIGVLLTRGHPTVIYPETALTFRVEAPVNIDTEHAPQAFRYADQSDYGPPAYTGAPPARMAAPGYGYAPAPYPPAPYYGPSYYPYYYPYPYWGGLSFYVGPRFYYGQRYYAGGLWIRHR